jgi:hypothetical protein
MALTGPSDGPPLGPPAGLVDRLAALGASMAERAASLGGRLEVNPLELLSERAAIAGLRRAGSVSCGGGSRLLRSLDDWVCVSLARDEDVDLLEAWLQVPRGELDPWCFVESAACAVPSDRLVERAAMLGLPVAALSERAGPGPTSPTTSAVGMLPVLGPATGGSRLADLTVVDLSSLWAGPLCGSLLHDAGATVIKVESTTRPDGARSGPAGFFDLMNAGKRSVAFDFTERAGIQGLLDLLAAADVVIEASRPRALEQMGIDAVALVARGGPRVWVSITGHGRVGDAGSRVAFGDDAAVAGGLVAWAEAVPMFCADAIADPLTGVVAADAVLRALDSGGRWVLDVAMSQVACAFAGSTIAAPPSLTVADPRSRRSRGSAATLGSDTGEVLDRLTLDAGRA